MHKNIKDTVFLKSYKKVLDVEVVKKNKEEAARKKFKEDIKRAKEISEILTGRIKENYGTFKKAAEEFEKFSCVCLDSSIRFVGLYARGYFASRVSDSNIKKIIDHTRSTKKDLEKIALLYHLLGVNEKDRLVELMGQINSMFEYPLGLTTEQKMYLEKNIINEGID